MTSIDPQALLAMGRKVLAIEADAIRELAPRLDEPFVAACRICLSCTGRIVVMGMGKSGHIGGKIAATLASTGSPAFFVHPGEAGHGDVGMVTRDDVLIAVSNSGATAEITTILPLMRRLGVPLIAMTGKADSLLGRAAEVVLDVSVREEACPLNLAPTASTTATLAMGDALAVALLEARDFTSDDFARSHPGGSLGRRLLLRVDDVMHAGDEVPSVGSDTLLSAALMEITRKRLGITGVVDGDGILLGVFTDGDLRRVLDRRLDLHETKIGEVMARHPKTIRNNVLAAEAVHLIEKHQITALLVTDEAGRLVGALNLHDLFRAGVM